MNSRQQLVLFSMFAFCSILAHAQNSSCEAIIQMSRVSNSQYYSATKVQAEAQEFCNEFQKYKSSGKLSSIGASYKLFSGNAAKTSSNVEDIASKYCGGSSSNSADQNAHRTYIETIAPGAYLAYERCLAMGSHGVHTTILSRDNSKMILQVSHKTGSSSDKALMTFTASGSAQCAWLDKKELPAERVVDGNTTRLIECSRPAGDTTDTTVVVSRQDSGNGDGVQFEWRLQSQAAKDAELAQMKAQYNELKNELVHTWASLAGGVLAFESTSCPAGWSDYTPAYGRFIRAIDRSAKPIDPLGLRAPGSLQDADLAPHTHSTFGYNHEHGLYKRAGKGNSNFDALNVQAITVKESSSGSGKETRPANVALLFCQRAS